MEGDYEFPVNIGNPDEYTIRHFAELIADITNSSSKIVHLPATKDDPQQRRPDITLAKERIGWSPRYTVREGLERAIGYFLDEVTRRGSIQTVGPGEFAGVALGKHARIQVQDKHIVTR
eukprot:03312_4